MIGRLVSTPLSHPRGRLFTALWYLKFRLHDLDELVPYVASSEIWPAARLHQAAHRTAVIDLIQMSLDLVYQTSRRWLLANMLTRK